MSEATLSNPFNSNNHIPSQPAWRVTKEEREAAIEAAKKEAACFWEPYWIPKNKR